SRHLANTLPQSRSRLSEAAGKKGFTLRIGRSLPAAGSGTNRSAGSRRVGLARGRSGTISASRRFALAAPQQIAPRSRKGFPGFPLFTKGFAMPRKPFVGLNADYRPSRKEGPA